MKKTDAFDEQKFFAHFPTEESQKIHDFAIDTVFRHSRYIFTKRRGKKQFGFCTHCKQEFETVGLKHNKRSVCPHCSSECTVKASGISRIRLVDEAYFVYYEKSVINPNAIIARGFLAVRNYTGDYTNVETVMALHTAYLFEPGAGGIMYSRGLWYWDSDNGIKGLDYDWNRRSGVFSQAGSAMAHKECFVSMESIKESIAGTPFQYSTWDRYKDGDMVKFFDFYAKYPCIEYLTKLGLGELVVAKLEGRRTYGAIQWRAKSIQKVLGLTKHQIKEVLDGAWSVDPKELKIMQTAAKDGSKVSVRDVLELAEYIRDYHSFSLVLRYVNVQKALSYIRKQLNNHIFKYGRDVITDWWDYLSDCKKLQMDLTQEDTLFPSNLRRAHENTSKQVKLQSDELLNRQITKRLEVLNKFCFADENLLLRPAASSDELIAEGKILKHCVGTYADRHASGETTIFLIRQTEEPDAPFFTMEVKGNEVRQCRGLRNCSMTDDVSEFVDSFKRERLDKLSTKSKSKKVQGVAV